MHPIHGWNQEEEDIKCIELLNCNKENLLKLSHKDREWIVNTTLKNLIREKNTSGAFEFNISCHHIPTFEEGKSSNQPKELVKETILENVDIPILEKVLEVTHVDDLQERFSKLDQALIEMAIAQGLQIQTNEDNNLLCIRIISKILNTKKALKFVKYNRIGGPCLHYVFIHMRYH